MSATAEASGSPHYDGRAQLIELARAPGRRSKLLDWRQAAELRNAVDALLDRAQSWRPPPRRPQDGPPGPDELLMIVLRSRRAAGTGPRTRATSRCSWRSASSAARCLTPCAPSTWRTISGCSRRAG